MRRLGIQKNIHVSDIKNMLDLRLSFINSHLTVDKPFPVIPRALACPLKMSCLLEVRSMPALIIKLRLLIVMHMNVFSWYPLYH